MAVAEKATTSLVIDDEEYSMVEQPSEKSSLVVALRNDLYGELNLKLLVDHLKSVARFVRVAYYATGAAPAVKEVQEIRIDIYHIGNNISKLCDQSASTVASFRSTSRTVLNELQAAYEYMIDGLEEEALESLSALSEYANKMAVAAEKMRVKFEMQAEEVDKIATKTMDTQGTHERKADEMKKEQKKLEEDKKLAEKKEKDFRKYEEDARKEKMRYQEKEDAEIASINTGFLPTLGRMILGQTGREKADEFRKTKIEFLEEEMKNRKLRQEEMANQAAVLKKMSECKFNEIEYTLVAEFLHHAVTALKGLAAVMQKAVLFWEKLQEHCQSLAEDGIKKKVARVLSKSSEEERLKVWTSRAFKKQAITYFAKWVALYTTCGDYQHEIGMTQKELYIYITENPSRDECRAKLRELCQDFNKDADMAQVKSEELDTMARKKIEDLKKNKDEEF